MQKILGYARVSTGSQVEDRQVIAIRNFCNQRNYKLFKDKIYIDKCTGKTYDRPEYNMVKEILDSGDILILEELDRLGRTKEGILKELREFKEKSIRVMILNIPTTLMDLSSVNDDMAKALLEMIDDILIGLYAYEAEHEVAQRAKRQHEGMEAMRKRGDWNLYGRPRRLNMEQFEKEYQRVLSHEIKPFELIKELGIPKGTYYRYKAEYEKCLQVKFCI